MKNLLSYALTLSAMIMPCAHAQVVVSPEISASAQAAVQELGTEMIKGNFKFGNQKIYPRWKRRLAMRNGGMAKLDAKLTAAAQQKAILGLSVTGFKASKPTAFFSVWKAKKMDPNTNKPVKDANGNHIMLDHWLAIVPTITRVKVRDPQKGIMRELEETSYTVAIREKSSKTWTFLTGMKPTVKDLRGMFPTLPKDEKALGLPKGSVREIK
ncbi:MAG: hypothetical protein ACPG6P_13580 [Akkermansiaceae bacterium]